MFGIDWSDPQTLWLNLTNLALGVVTLLAVAAVGGAVAWELVLKHRRAQEEASPHTLSIPELGLTMADGGEPVEPPKRK